jgi:ATP-dependent RNA helicase RhlE
VIAAIPRQRQTLFFSATMPPEVQRLSASLLHNPVKVEVTPVSSTAETVEQEVFFVDKANKPQLLVHLLNTRDIKEALVFSRTKHGADKLVRIIEKAGIRAEAIHGNKAQNARQRALSNFKERKTRVLVATDIAARGIDIDSLSHVVNFDIPNVPETYVHRIGRTGRAGASGIAISLCDVDERVFLRDITKLIARQIPVVEDHPFPASGNASKPLPPEPPRGQGRQGGGRNSGGRSQGGRSGGNSGGSGQPKDFAALTAELINDLEGGGPKAKPASGASKTNSRRRWRGPRPGGGGGQR